MIPLFCKGIYPPKDAKVTTLQIYSTNDAHNRTVRSPIPQFITNRYFHIQYTTLYHNDFAFNLPQTNNYTPNTKHQHTRKLKLIFLHMYIFILWLSAMPSRTFGIVCYQRYAFKVCFISRVHFERHLCRYIFADSMSPTYIFQFYNTCGTG